VLSIARNDFFTGEFVSIYLGTFSVLQQLLAEHKTAAAVLEENKKQVYRLLLGVKILPQNGCSM